MQKESKARFVWPYSAAYWAGRRKAGPHRDLDPQLHLAGQDEQTGVILSYMLLRFTSRERSILSCSLTIVVRRRTSTLRRPLSGEAGAHHPVVDQPSHALDQILVADSA